MKRWFYKGKSNKQFSGYLRRLDKLNVLIRGDIRSFKRQIY